MTSFLISTLYSTLGLTVDEQTTVNAALPTISALLDVIDAHLADVTTAQRLLAANKAPIKKLLADVAVIGPNISASMVDGSVDLFATLGAYNDIKSVIAANPKNVAAATALFNDLLPVINQAITDWPKISPAV